MRGLYRLCLGIKGWRSDADTAIAMAAPLYPTSHVAAIMYKYILSIPIGARLADSVALRETAEALQIAEQAGDDFTLVQAQLARDWFLFTTTVFSGRASTSCHEPVTLRSSRASP
jgi:hypothetical protein